MATKKTKKKDSKVVDSILSILKKTILPNMLDKITDKIHHEINAVTRNVEHKMKSVIDHFMNKFVQAMLLLLSFTFIVFGGLYFFIDIIRIDRSFVLFGLGLILLIIVFVSNSKTKN